MMERIESPLLLYLHKRIDLDKACRSVHEWASTHHDASALRQAYQYVQTLYQKHKIDLKAQRKLMQALHHNDHPDLI